MSLKAQKYLESYSTSTYSKQKPKVHEYHSSPMGASRHLCCLFSHYHSSGKTQQVEPESSIPWYHLACCWQTWVSVPAQMYKVRWLQATFLLSGYQYPCLRGSWVKCQLWRPLLESLRGIDGAIFLLAASSVSNRYQVLDEDGYLQVSGHPQLWLWPLCDSCCCA